MRQNCLTFREDGTFKVLQLTDVHYTRDDDRDHRTAKVMEECIEAEQPDFIMVTGDLVFGEDNLKNLDKAVRPLVESSIPWSFVFGNHDVEENSDEKTLFSLLEEKRGFIGYHDEACPEKQGNHMLPVCDRQGHVHWVIAGLNSGTYNPNPRVGGYGYVSGAQMDWYVKRLAEYEKQDKDFSVLTFQHIPICEIEEVWRFEHSYGYHIDKFAVPNVNSGEFFRMTEDGHTRGLFFGHDHFNSIYGEHFGITLGYCRGVGFGSYGPDDFPRGGRVFVLKESDLEHFQTWEILEGKRRLMDPWKRKPEELGRF